MRHDAPPLEDVAHNYCPHCGARTPAADEFCRACGAPLAAAPDTRTTVAARVVDGDGQGPPAAAVKQRAWYRRPIIAALVVLLLALAVGGYLVIRALTDDSADRSTASLTTGRSLVVGLATDAAQVTRLDGVRDIGTRATAQEARIRAAINRLIHIRNKQMRKASTATLLAEDAVMLDLARLARINPLNLKPWTQVDSALRSDATRLADTAAGVDRAGLRETLVPTAAVIIAAGDNLDGVITRADRKLRRWRSAVARATKRQRGDLAALATYAASMRGQLARYSSLRTDMQAWIDHVNSDGATFGEAYGFLGDAAGQRVAVRDAIGAMRVPHAMLAAHNRLRSVITSSIGALDAATSGIADYQSSFNHSSYDKTEGWRSFEATSQQISTEYADATAAWETQLTRTRNTIHTRPMPRRPDV